MQLYLKLLLAAAIFVLGASAPLRQTIEDFAYDARVAYVCARGNPDEFESLVDDTQRDLATKAGGLDAYRFGKRCRELLDDRLAEAERLDLSLTEDELQEMRQDCAKQAFDASPWGQARREGETRDPFG